MFSSAMSLGPAEYFGAIWSSFEDIQSEVKAKTVAGQTDMHAMHYGGPKKLGQRLQYEEGIQGEAKLRLW